LRGISDRALAAHKGRRAKTIREIKSAMTFFLARVELHWAPQDSDDYKKLYEEMQKVGFNRVQPVDLASRPRDQG
jgi:hypothetical protein